MKRIIQLVLLATMLAVVASAEGPGGTPTGSDGASQGRSR